MNKKVLVMGGSYFIGKKIVEVLLAHHYSVFTLNRGTKANQDIRIVNLIADRNDASQMQSTLSQHTFDIVIDVSGINDIQMDILYQALDRTHLKQFIFISTSAVYDINKVPAPQKEDSPLGDNTYWTPYGTNKVKSENYLKDRFQNTETQLTILRPPYVYGEYNYGQRESFIFDHIHNDLPIIIPNQGSAQIQFIYVTDLANIVVKLLQTTLESVAIFNVGNKLPTTIRKWIKQCEDIVGKDATVIQYDYKKHNRKETDFFPFFDYDVYLDVTKINAIMNEEIDFKIGLENAYRWYCDHKEDIVFSEKIKQNEKMILKEELDLN